MNRKVYKDYSLSTDCGESATLNKTYTHGVGVYKKMAKMQLSQVRITDTKEGTEFSYNADVEPKKSTLGNSYFGTLSSQGIAKLQSMGYNVHNEGGWIDLLKQTFGFNDDEIGNRGAKWDTLEARARYKVHINDVPFEPEFTAKQKARMEQVAEVIATTPAMEVPTAPVQAVAVPQPPQAQADTVQVAVPQPPAPTPQVATPQPPQAVPQAPAQAVAPPKLTADEIGLVGKIQEYQGQGVADNLIIQSLGQKVGVAKAKHLLGLAKLGF